MRKKSNKNLQKRRFPVFSAGKKFFLKIGLGHIMGIGNTHLCAKNQKKLMMKSRANAKKPVFPAFSTGKIKCFSKIGLGQILDITILHRVCKTLWKNIKYSLRNSRNTVFRRKSVVPAIFRKLRLQKSV